MKDIQQILMSRYDHIRKALIHEPRGHKDMFGAIIFPPLQPGSDFGVISWHNFNTYYKQLADSWIVFDTSGHLPIILNKSEAQ